MSVIIKTFTTPGGKYVYDRSTHKLLSIPDDEYPVFTRIEAGNPNETDLEILKRYQDHGFCQENVIEEIYHPATTLMAYRLESGISQLTMQVTQACNLRCTYCSYSGAYDNQRTHANKTMPLATMKKCVDLNSLLKVFPCEFNNFQRVEEGTPESLIISEQIRNRL